VAFGWQQVWPDFREGWRFVMRHRKIQAAMAQLVTVATLVMVMAMIAPGYAARVGPYLDLIIRKGSVR
jgi:FMN-dependent NADH-azoreductase